MNVFFKGVYALKAKRSSISSARVVVLETRYVKVGQSSNLLYQGFAEKYFLCIYLNSKAKYKKKENWEVSVHLDEQWCYEVNPFALKSDFHVICLMLIYIYYIS